MTEAQLQKAILKLLPSLGVVAWRNQSGTARVKRGVMHLSPAGTPDIIGYRKTDGKMVAIEVKGPMGVLGVDQERWLMNAGGAGVLAFVAWSIEDVTRFMRLNMGARV